MSFFSLISRLRLFSFYWFLLYCCIPKGQISGWLLCSKTKKGVWGKRWLKTETALNLPVTVLICLTLEFVSIIFCFFPPDYWGIGCAMQTIHCPEIFLKAFAVVADHVTLYKAGLLHHLSNNFFEFIACLYNLNCFHIYFTFWHQWWTDRMMWLGFFTRPRITVLSWKGSTWPCTGQFWSHTLCLGAVQTLPELCHGAVTTAQPPSGWRTFS